VARVSLITSSCSRSRIAWLFPESTVTFSVGTPAHDGSVPITLVASATAVFVTLTTEAQGRFSDNALILPPGVTEVSFLPWSPVNLTVLSATLRLESLASYPMNVSLKDYYSSRVCAGVFLSIDSQVALALA